MEEESKISHGFDRGVDFTEIKDRLVNSYNNLTEELKREDMTKPNIIKILNNKIIYNLIALIQLRNGSRISEACKAFILFIQKSNLNEKVVVKIAKSESTKYKKDSNESFKTKARFRKIVFPNNWIKVKDVDVIGVYLNMIPANRLKKRVLDFLLKNFECNTHSLRYAFINYMLYDEKKEMAIVAKFVGHVNVQQLVTYTQQKNCDKLFDIDI